MIHNYNNKVYRQRKKGVDVDYLRLSDFAALDDFSKDLTLRYTESYRRRGSERMTEYGVKQYEIDYAKTLLDRANKIREERLNKMQPSARKGNLQMIGRANLQARSLNLSSPENFAKMLKSLELEANPQHWHENDEQYKKSYFEAAENCLGKKAAGYIKRALKNVDATDLYLIAAEEPELYIDYVYIPNDTNATERAKSIRDKWQQVLKERGIA